MNADPRIPEVAAPWWNMAQDDLTAAERVTDIPYVCGFHRQQAVEKATKCLLVLYQIELPRSHVIGELLSLLETARPVPETDRDDLDALTRLAVPARYPPAAVTAKEALDALAVGPRFLGWVRGTLPPGVRRLGPPE